MFTSSSGKWARFTEDLDLVFGPAVAGDWSEFGFYSGEVRKAVNYGCQYRDENNSLISLFPIKNLDLFIEQFGFALENTDTSIVTIVDDSAANNELDEYHNRKKAEEETAAMIPSEDDIYRAEQLLLLTEICNKLGDING